MMELVYRANKISDICIGKKWVNSEEIQAKYKKKFREYKGDFKELTFKRLLKITLASTILYENLI